MSQSTALPSAWVDRLFQRFSVMYGKHWADQWEGVPMADVKDAWRTELGGIRGEQLGKALQSCGKFPPTLPEFVALCRQAVTPPAQRLFLPSPQTDATRDAKVIPPEVKAELERLLAKMRVEP